MVWVPATRRSEGPARACKLFPVVVAGSVRYCFARVVLHPMERVEVPGFRRREQAAAKLPGHRSALGKGGESRGGFESQTQPSVLVLRILLR